MSALPITDIALSGFGLIRRHPGELAIWAAVRLVVNLGMGMLLVLLGAQRLSQLQEISQTEADVSLQQIGAALLSAWPVILVLAPLSLLVQSVLYAAIYRAWLRPAEGAAAYLRVGRDELRLMAVTVLWMLLFAAMLFGVTFAAGIVAVVADEALKPLAALTGLLLFIAVVFTLLWAMVRLSLAWTSTFDHQRVELLKSWRLTKARFWPLSGAYVIAFALSLVASLGVVALFAIVALFVALGSGAGMDAAGAIFSAEATTLAGYFTVGMLAYLAMEAVISTLTTVLLLTPTAEAYRLLSTEAGTAGPRPA